MSVECWFSCSIVLIWRDKIIYVLLCRLPALAEATYRDHFCRLASASQKISVTFFSGTTQASFLIFGTEHQYGELYRVTIFESAACPLPVLCDFEYCGHRQICSQDNFCHIFLGNHRGQLPDIWHRASVCRTVSCNAVLNLRHVHFLYDTTLNI